MKLLYFLTFILIALPAKAQKTGRPLVDSLIAGLPVIRNDTVKARTYHRIFNELCSVNIEEALSYANRGLAFVKNMKWQKGISVFQDNIGRAYSEQGNYDSAILYFNQSLIINKKIGESGNMASTYNNMGVAAQNIRADYAAAADYYFKALRITEQIKDSLLMATTLKNISVIYSGQENVEKALDFARSALLINEKIKNVQGIALSMENFGNIYASRKNFKEAEMYYRKALDIYEESGNREGVASTLGALAIVYTGNYRKAIEVRLKARDLWTQINPFNVKSITNTGNIGIAYLHIARYDSLHAVRYGDIIPDDQKALLQKAENYLTEAIQLSDQIGEPNSSSYYTAALAELQEFKGDYKNAYYNFKIYKEIQDSLYSQESKNKIAGAESKRLMDKKDSELKINQLLLYDQRKKIAGLVFGIALFSIIGFLLYRQGQIRKKNNDTLLRLNRELDEANKTKARFFGMLSHDLRSPIARLVSFLDLQMNDPALFTPEQTIVHQQKIRQSAESLLESMETMLLWSKGQMENFKPCIKELRIDDLFDYIEKSFADVDDVRFHFIKEPDLALNTDANYLQIILYNLTSNAVKAVAGLPDAGIEWKAWKENGHLFISISDNGTGISNEQVKGLFGESVITGDKQGLGLHLIKELAAAIRCRISIKHTQRGTHFILSFNDPLNP